MHAYTQPDKSQEMSDAGCLTVAGLSSDKKNCKMSSITLCDFLCYKLHVFFLFIFKDFITSKSLKGSRAHNVPYVVCSSHLVILLLKHLIRGHHLLPLSVSSCAQSSLSSLAGDEKKHLFILSVSTRPSTTQTPCSFFLEPYATNAKTKISLTSLAGRSSRTLFKHTAPSSPLIPPPVIASLCHRLD